MKALRVGLVGYGYAGKTFHAPLIAAEPRLRLAAVASSDPEKVTRDLDDVRVVADPLALANDPDIDLLVIASPNATHAPIARAALTAGRHVVVDKPFALDLAEARDLAALAAECQRHLAVFHNRRWDSDFLTVVSALKAGVVGFPLHFESHFDRFRPVVRSRWREAAVPGGGLWSDLGPHLIDQSLCLFGLPDRVWASFALQRAGAQVEDWAHVVLETGPRRMVLHAGMLVAGGVPRFAVHGDAGSVVKERADVQERQLLAGVMPGSDGWGSDPDPPIAYDAEGHPRPIPAKAGDQRAFYRELAMALAGEAPNPVPPVQALAVMAVLDAAIEAARTGRSVEPALTPREKAEYAAARDRRWTATV